MLSRKTSPHRRALSANPQLNMNYSLTYGGILTIFIGTFLVNAFGISDACSSELTAKLVEYAPMLIGGFMALIGRFRLGEVTPLGFRK
jgi:hypothetical protein